MGFPKRRNRILAPVRVFLYAIACNFCSERGLPLGEAFGGSSTIRRRRDLGIWSGTAIEHRSIGVTPPLYGSAGDDNRSSSSNDDNTASYWKLPNDFSMFLTQRSIQSFMFLTSQLHDPETCYWVEDFTQPNLVNNKHGESSFSLSDSIPNLGDIATGTPGWTPGSGGGSSKQKEETEADKRTCHLLRYHGLAAMDTTLFPTWESYFERLLEQPTDSWVIASDQPHVPEYTWDIDPASLCSRILSVREQLAREFARDLKTVSDMGGQTFDWYWEKLKRSRDAKDSDDATNWNNNNNDGNQDDDESPALSSSSSNTDSPLNVDPTSLRGSRENLLFLEISVDDPTSDHKPSPLRRSNFDLLLLLATEEAIQRVLNRWESMRSEGDLTGSEDASQSFLEGFYQEREHCFQGPLRSYGRADDLLEELLDSALLFGERGAVHPTKIAELVLKEREKVALDWMEIAEESPVHHMRIQKLRLDRMMGASMGGSDSSSNSSSSNESEVARNGSFDPGPGAFE